MSNRYRLITGLSAAVVIVAVLLCLCFVSFDNINDVFAFNTSNITSGSVDIGNILLEGYADRADGKVFDGDVLTSLYSKLTGSTSKSKLKDVGAMGTLTAADIRDKNGGKDIIFMTDNIIWTVTHLTKDKFGNIIVTLWQALNTTTLQWNQWFNPASNMTYPCNVYGTSYIRSRGLNIGSEYVETNNAVSLTRSSQDETHIYARLTMPSVKNSLTNYIVKPSAVAYQATENNMAGGTIGGRGYTLANDAYGTPSGTIKWSENSKLNFDVSELPTKTGYSAWKDDYIWLPSLTEVGESNSICGIWELSEAQRSNYSNSWLRSSGMQNANVALCISAEGLGNGYMYTVTNSCAVRPAFHLNLTAADAAALFGLKEPSDVTVEYTGEELGMEDIAESQKDWYDTDKIDIDYQDVKILESGEYELTAKIKEAFVKDGVKFFGTPGAGESKTTRKFKYTVTKKKIGVTAQIGSNGMPTFSMNDVGDIYSGDTEGNGRAPKLKLNYSDSGGNVTDAPPTAVGSYTATVVIDNECNYEIDTSSAYKVNFTIEKRQIVKPSISGASSAEYNGELQSFALSGVSDDIRIECGEGLTYEGRALKAKKAGKYTVKVSLADDGVSTKWTDGSIATFTLQVEIRKRALGIVIESGVGWEWGVDDTPEIRIIGDSLAGDRTELYIYYMKSGDSNKYDDINNNKTFSADFKTRTIKMPKLAQGAYTIAVELMDESARDNINYTMAAPKTTMFKVKGNEITFDASEDLKWRYNGKTIADWSKLQEYVYDVNGYRFDIDDSKLKDMGVKIDATKGTNGYSGDVQATNAKSGAYGVTVYITELDNTYAEFDAVYTLNYTIEKAKYDLSGLSWNYDDSNPLQFIAGKAQGITLTGTLPTGLTATYTGNGNIPVGSYTTTVSFKVSDAVNYYTPISTDSNTYLGTFDWSKAWRIDKATITCSWKIDNRENAATYNLPILQSVGVIDADSMVTYKYYDYTGGSQGDEVTIADINANINEEHRYLVVAVLKSEHTSNYTLDNDRTDFTVGVNRYPVKLKMDIDGQTLPYRPEGYTPKVTVDSAGGLTLDAITLTYYMDGETSGSTAIPVAVGRYRVVAELKYGGDANYIENGEFSFEIVKADIDVSGLKWQYSHGDVTATYDAEQGKWLLADGTEASAFVYDGTAHAISLIGADSLIAGISVATSGNLSESNAGSYTASATFTYNKNCYNTPEFAMALSWTVNKAIVNTSAIEWGYVDKDGNELKYTDAFVYTRISGAAVEYSVKLINLPDALKDCITYSDDYAKSEAGSYRARYSFNDAEFDSANYEPCVMPSGLGTYFDWVISPRTLEKPEYDGSWSVFDDTVHDFSEMFGLEEGWSDYIAISVKLDGAPYEGLTGDDFADVDGKPYKAYGAGEYKVTFSLINAGNNLIFSSRPQQDIAVSVAKYSLEIAEWNDNDEYSTAVTPTGALPVYFDYRYVDADGNVLTLGDMETGSYYYREVYVKDRYAGNAEAKGNVKFEFMMPLAPDDVKTPVAKPTLPTDGSKVVYYNGSERAFDAATLAELFGLTGFNSDYMEIVYEDADGTSKSGETNAGEYKIKIRFTSGLYCWDNGDGTTSDGDLELTVKIAKAQLPSQWNSGGKVPTISVPESLADCLSNDAFNYTYTDEDGNTVSKSDMVAGKTYSVKATLKPEYAANFEFIDVNGAVLPDATASTSHEFDYSTGDSDNDNDNSGGNNWDGVDIFGESLWFKVHVIAECVMIGVTVFIAVLVVVLIVKVNSKKKRRTDSNDREDKQ